MTINNARAAATLAFWLCVAASLIVVKSCAVAMSKQTQTRAEEE